MPRIFRGRGATILRAIPISIYNLDSDFLDSGPAGVDALDITGGWDLTTDSMVSGNPGTSAFTDGGAYLQIDSAHVVTAVTVSFYYQDNGSAAKAILFAGTGDQTTAAGDFSLELLADGKLRGYHVGQDGVLRFFEQTAGITGTDLRDGDAHRIDMTLGPVGAKLYLDGAELAAAAIPTNTNGWNNDRVKFIGRWIDGVQAPATGAYDLIRIWDRQLTGAEIAALEAPQTITLGSPPAAQDEITVPLMTEWLTNDDMSIPGGTVRYAKPSGSGTGGSSEGAAGAIAATLAASSSGHAVVLIPDSGTLAVFDVPGGITIPAGVTLMAKPDTAAIISQYEEFSGARTPNNNFWTQSGLSGDDISKKIWRSVGTFSASNSAVTGVWLEFDHIHRLVPYKSMNDLRSPYSATGRDPPNAYLGPGAFMSSDGRLYIRMQKPHPDKYSFDRKWPAHTWRGFPEAISGGALNYPVSENPNDYEIRLGRQVFGSLAMNVGANATIGSGINSLGFDHTFDWHGNNGVTVRRGTDIAWRFQFQWNNTSGTDWTVMRRRMGNGSILNQNYETYKFGGYIEGQRDLFIAAGNQSGAAFKLDNLVFKDCTITDWHDLEAGNQRKRRFRNCTFFNIWDDGFQNGPSCQQWEIGYCYWLNSAFGGNGTGDFDNFFIGEWFFHHNIIDLRVPRCYGDGDQGIGGRFAYLNHSAENSPQPKKVYNNVWLGEPDMISNQGTGLDHNDFADNNSAFGHEVFNNIVIRHGWQRYFPVAVIASSAGIDHAMSRIVCDDANSLEYWDYNAYYRQLPGAAEEGFFRYVNNTGRSFSSGAQDFASLAAFRASALHDLSQGHYAPGFETNGTDVKPTLASLDNFPADRFKYRPTSTAVVTVATASTSLSGDNWWSSSPTWGTGVAWDDGEKTLQPSPYKGALDPAGNTIPVGVQNP